MLHDFGPTMGERMIAQAIRDEVWRRRRRTIYMALAVIAVGALVWMAIK